MGSTRLPGKALMKIGNNTLVEEVYKKSNKFNGWSELSVAICDEEVKKLLVIKKDFTLLECNKIKIAVKT